MIALDDIKNLTPQERLEVFAKINSKDLELVMHHCSVELQERALVEPPKVYEGTDGRRYIVLEDESIKFVDEDDDLGRQTAEERKIWL